MDKLNGTDLLQVISTVFAIALGVASSFISIKTNGVINKKGVWVLAFFVISVVSAVSATISKSIEENDKRQLDSDDRNNQYKDIINKNGNTLKKANETLDLTNKVLENTDISIQSLIELQHTSDELNSRLKEELMIQKDINRLSNRILSDLKESDSLKLKQSKIELCNILTKISTELGYFKLHLIKNESHKKYDSVYQEITSLLLSIKSQFGEQLNNFYLLKNDSLKIVWIKVNNSLQHLTRQVLYYPGKEQNSEILSKELNRIFIEDILGEVHDKLNCN